ncbi:hypothetical protein E3Q13_02592 [Wallemia mellicola]|nr:hypothetical protein E3Q13_02592 [Wallemia mellicola]
MELLQEALESQAEISKVQKVALLSHLKALNRDNSALIRQSKQNAAHQAQLSDNVHAKVQNLLYERRHLEQEIERCRNFKTTYDKLPLISLEEYNSIQRDEESMKDNDEHTLMLNRLRHELNTRRELSDRRKELQDIRSAVNSENNATKNSLEDLDSDLDKFVDFARGIQLKLNKLDKVWEDAENKEEEKDDGKNDPIELDQDNEADKVQDTREDDEMDTN